MCVDTPAVDHKLFGALQRVSPEEVTHAMLLSVAEAITAKADDTVLGKWSNLFRMVNMVFEVVPAGITRFWKAQNLREDLVEAGESVRRSVRQRIYEVARFKAEREKELGHEVTPEKIAQEYAKQVKFSRATEKVTKGFVDAAITIYKRLLSLPAAREVLEWCDTHLLGTRDNPFESAWVLQAIIDRAKTPDTISYVMETLLDHWRMNYIDAGHFVVSKIKDPRLSYVEVLKLKMAMRHELLGAWLQSSGVEASAKAALVEIFSGGASAVRKKQCSYPGEVWPDLSWQLGRKQSGVLAAALFEDLLFSDVFDGRYRDGVKSKATTGGRPGL